MLIEAEALRAHVKFNKHAMESFEECEANESAVSQIKSMNKIIDGSMNYATISSGTKIRNFMNEFVRNAKSSIQDVKRSLIYDKIMTDECVDCTGAITFIKSRWKDIKQLQDLIHREFKIVKNGSMKRDRSSSYAEIDKKKYALMKDFISAIESSDKKDKEVKLSEVKEVLNNLDELIMDMGRTADDLNVILKRLEMTTTDIYICESISNLLQYITYIINTYTYMTNEVLKSIKPV